MRVVFAGTPVFALSSLEALIADVQTEVVAVYTQPDRPAGRGKKLSASPVKQRAQALGIDVRQPESFKDTAEIDGLAEMQPDLMVVTAYGLILPRAVLQIPRLGCVNVHASLLPRWRGAAPVQRAIEAGDAVTGVTLMQMDQGLDSGDMLGWRQVEIASDDTGGSLHDKLATLGGELLKEMLNDIYAGTIEPLSQDQSKVTYARKLSKAEATIDWSDPAEKIVHKVHAFNPWPAAVAEFCQLNIRILRAEAIAYEGDAAPGQVLNADKSGILVAAGNGAVSVQEIQKPGGKPMAIASFLNGMQVQKGMKFG